jgi:formate hydrogenlyase transcriptional activator
MASANLVLQSTEDNNSRCACGGLSVEGFEPTSGPDSGLRWELQREKARLKLLVELTNQTVSKQELGDVVRAVMVAIRSGVRCDGVCIYLPPREGGELQVYTLDFPGDADFQKGTPIPLSGTIAGHVVQTARPWSGTREEACAQFPGQLLLRPGFSTGCMLPISGRNRVVGTLGLVRCEDNSFSQEEVDFLMQASNHIAIGVENALAYQQIRELREKLVQENVYLQAEVRNETNFVVIVGGRAAPGRVPAQNETVAPTDEVDGRVRNAALREEIDQTSIFEEIVGTSSALRTVLSRISKVAPSDSTVLITGETGTGKELVARAIHRRSERSGRPFVSVNCAAIPSDLIASELFGHEKGAFTGAMQRRLGRFEMADGGTIFLDEVGDLSPDTQVALLRVLQEREFERVGGGHPIHVDVRVIAATNRDLQAAVADGTFRQDLFYRLDVFPIDVPPLRERRDDILMLVEYFAQRYAGRAGKTVRSMEKKTLELLQSYQWPGNIRELQNVIERSVILSSGEALSVDEMWLSRETSQPPSQVEESPRFNGYVEARSERKIIEDALVESKGRVSGPSGAATKLGVPPSTLDHRIKALKIHKTQFKFR